MIRRNYLLSLLFALALALVAAGPTLACSKPAPGTGVHHDDLIWEAETIVVVRLESQTQMERASHIKYTLQTVETIKGTGQPSYEFVSRGSRHSGEDFRAHKAREFWKKDLGRSDWPCCICGPDHSFREGETYLYFPDQLGSMKSAELVRSDSDRWLTYVRARVKAAVNPTVKKDGRRLGRGLYAQ